MKRTIMFLLTFCLLLGGCGSDAEVYLAGEEESPKAAPQEESAAAENAEEPDSGDAQKDGTIWVYVCGAVHAPGVYELPSGSRIYHVIQAAGGMLPEAETRAVNQAQELSDGEQIVGVAIIGRPVSRHLDDGWTLEVNRLCTDGSRNACSMLYAAAWRAARAMGYKRLVTYILESENGASLRAAGWKCVGQAGGLRWTGRRRPEVDLYPAQMKIRFERTAE